MGKSKEIDYKTKEFLTRVRNLADYYGLSFFIVTEGASQTCNKDCEAVAYARECHKEWERSKGFNPDERWDMCVE